MKANDAMRGRFQDASRRLRALPRGVLLLLLALNMAACDFGAIGTDERAPRVQILRPGDQAPVGNDVIIRISAEPRGAEDNYVSFVNVNLNSKLLGEAELVEGSEPPVYIYRWNSNSVSDGEYRIEAVAFDRYQARGLSNPVRVRVLNTTAGEGPATVFVAPTEGEQVTGTVRVIAQKQEGEPDIVRMDFMVDGVVLATREQAPFEFEWDTSKEGSGDHLLQVRAFSAPDVFKYSDAIAVTVDASDDEDPGGTDTPTKPNADYRAVGFTGDVKGSVAVGFNNDLYIGTLSDTLYAFTPAGRLRWTFATQGPIRSTPVVGNNEDVFVTSEDGRLYGLTSTGAQLWPPYNTSTVLRSTPALGVEGYLYFGDGEGRVHAVNSFNGLSARDWPKKVADAPIVVPPVIMEDRTIIVAATDGYVYGLGPDGSTRWRSEANVGSVNVGMALADREITISFPNGETTTTKTTMIYIVSNNGSLYALSAEDGSLAWSYALTGPLRSGPVVGTDGAIYVGTSTGLIVLEEEANSYTSRLRYIYPAEDVGTPVIDANENIFFVSAQRVVAINPNNTPLWTETYDLKAQADGPLTIGRDGRIYVATNRGVMYGIQTGSVGLAPGKWPMFQRNARHTGRLGIDATDG